MGIVKICTCDNCKKTVKDPSELRAIEVRVQNARTYSYNVPYTVIGSRLICEQCEHSFGVANLGWTAQKEQPKVPTLEDFIVEIATNAAIEAIEAL